MTLEIARCRSCDAKIVWAKSKYGRLMPLDAVPVGEGVRFFIDEPFLPGPPSASEPVPIQNEGVPGYRSHFATCPNANEHRKPK
jgi:hypothetical protein